MHKYAPISDLVTLVKDNISPSTDCTKKWNRHHWQNAIKTTASVSRCMATHDSARINRQICAMIVVETDIKVWQVYETTYWLRSNNITQSYTDIIKRMKSVHAKWQQ
jgi:hypothetical protein